MSLTTVKIESSDGVVFHVDAEVTKVSAYLYGKHKDMLAQGRSDVIELMNVNSVILRKILQWGENYKGRTDAQPESGDLDQFVLNFMEVDPGTLFELIVSANHLQVSGLLDVTCKRVATMFKGKTPEEIRERFGITPGQVGFTPLEEAQIRRENEWCEQK